MRRFRIGVMFAISLQVVAFVIAAPSDPSSEDSEWDAAMEKSKDFFKQLFNGKVVRLYTPRVTASPEPSVKRDPSFLDQIMDLYRNVEIPEEGLAALPLQGKDQVDQLNYYREHPAELAWDVYRRIQYVRSRGGSINELSDVFTLQNRLRRDPKNKQDVIEQIGMGRSWIKLVRDPPGLDVPFPIHVVALMPEKIQSLTLTQEAALLPTAVRWPLRRPKAEVSSPQMKAEHKDCLRITSGMYAGQYQATAHGGPHSRGHSDAEWFAELFEPGKALPRRVAVLVSVDPTIRVAEHNGTEESRASPATSCLRSRMVSSLMRVRWEGLAYAVLPFKGNIIGLGDQESTVTFREWRTDRAQLLRDVNEFSCKTVAGKRSLSSNDWNTKEILNTLQRRLFSGQFRFGDTVIVVIATNDVMLEKWLELSLKSGGIQAYASSEGLAAGLDIAARSVMIKNLF